MSRKVVIASDAPSSITDTQIVVDGGRLAAIDPKSIWRRQIN